MIDQLHSFVIITGVSVNTMLTLLPMRNLLCVFIFVTLFLALNLFFDARICSNTWLFFSVNWFAPRLITFFCLNYQLSFASKKKDYFLIILDHWTFCIVIEFLVTWELLARFLLFYLVYMKLFSYLIKCVNYAIFSSTSVVITVWFTKNVSKLIYIFLVFSLLFRTWHKSRLLVNVSTVSRHWLFS